MRLEHNQRDKLRINRQFIHSNEKLKRSTIVISSPKYAVPVLHKSDRLNNNIPFMRMTERDEKQNWRRQTETVGLQRSMATI